MVTYILALQNTPYLYFIYLLASTRVTKSHIDILKSNSYFKLDFDTND